MNFISQALGKSADSIQRKDILDYIKDNEIQILNLCYIGSDSRLKSVSFPTTDIAYIDSVLSSGTRISNVFLDAKVKSEGAYIVPVYRDAFPNPFSEKPALNILCQCFNKDGEPLAAAPSTVLKRAAARFAKRTGLTLTAAGELEYYVLYPNGNDLFKATRKHYHSTAPLTVWEEIRNEVLYTIATLGIPVKYAHSEVGKLHYTESLDAEQHEIEFLPAPICEAADNTVISKWIICNIAKKHGVAATFCPVIRFGEVGSGLHFHLELLKAGENIILDSQGNISTEAKQLIGGILKFARSLSAFGNPTPASYLRLASKKESPYGICWGERTRKALIRIPMTPQGISTDIAASANPAEKEFAPISESPMVEFRAADGAAVIHLLLAALAVAAEAGLHNSDSLNIAEKLHISGEDILHKKLGSLPHSCRESAAELEKDREYYEKDGTFPHELIESVILELNSYKDEDILRNLSENEEKIKQLIEEYIYYSPFSFY